MLSVISFPAFAVEDEDLVSEAREKIIAKLQVHMYLGCLLNKYRFHALICTSI